MKAHLVLKPAREGQRTESALPTAETVNRLLASKETIEKAESAARQLGFNVLSVTPLQVTIEGSKEQFEKAFSSRLKLAGPAGKAAAAGRTSSKKTSKKKSTTHETPVSSEHWMWETPPELPAEMEDAVREIVLPQAIALH